MSERNDHWVTSFTVTVVHPKTTSPETVRRLVFSGLTMRLEDYLFQVGPGVSVGTQVDIEDGVSVTPDWYEGGDDD